MRRLGWIGTWMALSAIGYGGMGIMVGMARQTLTVAIPPNQAFTISFDDNETGVNFRWWCDGAISKNFTATELSTGKAVLNGITTYTVSVPGLAQGKHSCLISAFNDLGETKSDPIDVPVGNIPMKPGNIRIVVK